MNPIAAISICLIICTSAILIIFYLIHLEIKELKESINELFNE